MFSAVLPHPVGLPFTAQVTDGITTATKPLTLTINPAPDYYGRFGSGCAGAPYSQALAATGGATPSRLIPAASLPTGISKHVTGLISAPGTSGSFSITAR